MERIGNALLCDIVYHDRATNKVVLAGVFSGSISLGEVPAAFNASLYAEYWPSKLGPTEVDIQFLVNGELVGGAKIHIDVTDLESPAILIVPNYQFVIVASGEIVARAIVASGKTLPIFSKKIEVKASTVSPQPVA